MIPSNLTNIVFYSAHSYNDFRVEVEAIRDLLHEYGIQFVPLVGTADYFCRDYMPVQKNEQTLVQFTFKPDYLLKNINTRDFVSDPKFILKSNPFLNRFQIVNSDLVLDGGNLVHYSNKVIVTDKVLFDNRGLTAESIKKEIGELLDVKVILIPAYPGEETGHVDGILRFINDDTVLTITLDDEAEEWKSELCNVLSKEGIRVISLPMLPTNEDRADQWAYVNYLHVGEIIILPTLNKVNDLVVEKFFLDIFPGSKIHFIDFKRIIKFGGALNCFTWNIQGSFINEELLITEHKFIEKYPINPSHKRLILGTIHPHYVSDFKIDFFYGNECSLWKILHEAFPDLLEKPDDKDNILKFLNSTETSVSDTVLRCKRLSNSALDKDFIPLELNYSLVDEIKNSQIEEIFFTSGFDKNNAFRLFYEEILKLKITPDIKINRQVVLPSEIFGRNVKLTILYSPSGAANRALVNSSMFKMNKELYNQFPDPIKQFKVDYYREKFSTLVNLSI